MAKRLLFVIVFTLCFPLLFVAVATMPITGLIALVRYVIEGDEQDKLFDFVLDPFMRAVDLPYKLTGRE